MTNEPDVDVECVVVGAGVVGLAIARSFQLAGIETFLIEANHCFGMETSSRNSEVIHAGIYYPAGSLKAQLCVEGRELLYAYAERRNIPHRRIGKLIVATDDSEIPILEKYLEAARANGVRDLAWVERGDLMQREPAVRAVRALHSPSTGIIDSHAFMQALLDDFEMAGGHLVCGVRIIGGQIEPDGLRLRDSNGDQYRARRVVNSAGLHAAALAASLTGFPSAHVPAARYAIGHYYVLQGSHPFSQLVYPVAVSGGLGVHVTIDMAGSARFGPDVRWIDAIDYTFDDSRRAEFVDAIRRYYPDLDETALQRGYTGIRPKLEWADRPAADFCIQRPADHGIPGFVNLFGIESPGLTASLAIALRVLTIA